MATTFQKKQTSVKAKTAFLTALVSLGLLGTAQMSSAADVDVGGFADAQVHWDSQNQQGDTFLIQDGALYLSSDLKGGKGMVDLPFAVGANGTQNNNFQLATRKAQAFVEYEYDNSVYWRLGQFDRVLGVEANDTADLLFTQESALADAALPRTHTGFLTGYQVEEAYDFRVWASNPTNPQSQGLLGADNPEFGGQALFTVGSMKFGLGGLYNKVGSESYYLVDLLYALDAGAWSFDLNVDFTESPNSSSTEWGSMGQAKFHLTDHLAAAVRGEYLSELGNNYEEYGAALGPHYSFTEALVTKLDYEFKSLKSVEGAESDQEHALALSAVYEF